MPPRAHLLARPAPTHPPALPPAVNFHLIQACNTRCRFCFATFKEVAGRLPTPHALALIDRLVEAGCEKLNFVGGEPTLHPDLKDLVRHSKRHGLVTSLVTNGHRLRPLLASCPGEIDWVGLSVDSSVEAVQAKLGRGQGDHVARSLKLASEVRAYGARVKLNTVLTSLNWMEDMSALVQEVRPERWKVFQVLPMKGQNDGAVGDLLISAGELTAFVVRHQHLAAEALAPLIEDNEAMKGSYAMIDPLGRFFGNATGEHVYSAPILEVGVPAALAEVGFVPSKFDQRGGRYAW